MKLDPNGYTDCDSTAPVTRTGKIAAVVGAVVCVGVFGYGLWCLGAVLRRWMGLP
jgi:hypothetical protein